MILYPGVKILDEQSNEYMIDEYISSGSFGSVFKAIRIIDNKEFAVKSIWVHHFPNERVKIAFENEINLATGIKNDHVIEYVYVHDGKSHQNLPPYIIMELATEGTLKSKLEEKKKIWVIFLWQRDNCNV